MELRTLALVCCLVLAGCSAPTPAYDDTPVEPTETDVGTSDPGSVSAPADPEEDQLGWENGYWYNESIAINQSDGLNESELEAFIARTMARVEWIRGAEFESTVPVEVISREEFRSGPGRDTTVDSSRERAREQLWEGMLLIGEDRTVGAAYEELYGGTVLGYYSPREDQIVIVSQNETPVVDRVTLAHELVHALQDQRFTFLRGDTHDSGIAGTSVTEGDASYVEQRYEERCGANWSCVDRPEQSSGADIADRNLGVYVTIYAPYSDGPAFIHDIYQRGGWNAVNQLYSQPPETTEQLIDPERYPDDGPETVQVPDRSGENWQRYGGAERVGESSTYAMLWFQRGLNRSTFSEESDPYSRYNYTAEATDGWAGDTFVTYRNGDAGGYVWKLRWESRDDAVEFASAYRTVLVDRLNASAVEPNVYRVPDSSPFGDAFRVTRDGRTVTIVNAPQVRALENVHASEE
ncbi:MAG: Hvo_1808 family surface protein [Halolamina sp.]|uniref:Hvo_1808 family surface protein n=1 Tax=Halolamina sp. TaxID=1940283 RepID=UPI002FC3542E